MAILCGETGLLDGSLKKITFTYGKTETVFESIPIPLSIPTDPQFTYTFESSLVITPSNSISYVPSPIWWVGGKNTTASSITVNVQAYKNGVALGSVTNRSVSANQFWTFCYHRCVPTIPAENHVIGDVFSVKVWSSASGLTLMHGGGMETPMRIDLGIKSGMLLKDFTIDITRPDFFITGVSGIQPNSAWTGSLNLYPSTHTGNHLLGYSDVNTAMIIPYICFPNSTIYKSMTLGNEFNNTVGINTSITNMPHVQTSYVPETIFYRETKLR